MLEDKGSLQLQIATLSKKIKRINLERSISLKILLFLAVVLIVGFLTPSQNQLYLNYDVGTIWTHEDVIAPFSFPIYKDEAEYQKEVKQAEANVHPVYDKIEVNGSRADTAVSVIDHIINVVRLNIKIMQDRNSRTFSKDSATLHSLLQSFSYKLTDADWHRLFSAVNRNPHIIKGLSGLVPIMRKIITDAYQPGIIDRPRNQVGSSIIVVRENHSETSVFSDQVLTLQDVSNQLEQAASTVFKGDTASARIISNAVVSQVTPNLTYDATQTQREINAAIDLVPRTIGFVKENERIIGKHDRITSEIKLKLDSLEKAMRERTGKTDVILQSIGKFLLIFVATGLLGLYIFLHRKKVFHSNKMLSLIGVLLIFEALLMYFVFTAQTTLPVEYLVLVPVASMIVAIIFDSRLAFQVTVVIAILVGSTKGNDFTAFFTALSAGALSVYTVRDIKNRTQIFRSLVFIFIGYSISSLAISLQQSEEATTILANLSLIAINSILSPIITFGFLIFFEKVFNIATDLTLLELSDFNQPLLRELSQKAPGTFHHSIIVGTLAEKAAEAVGANPILARVGAYYHDIGKILRPAYFIENTADSGKSKHEWLPPDVSVQMVVSHVTDGIELAKKYRLPQRVIDFIPMHHGTTLVAYFYGKALRRPFATGDVSEEDFRYDGPKPNSKETAIVMLADSIEAAVRSLQDKSLENVESMINAIVKSRYEEGQLDNTNLTLRDLTKIKESFLAVMSGIYHQRIEYPGQTDGPHQTSEKTIAIQDRIDAQMEPTDNPSESAGKLTQKEIEELAPPIFKEGRKRIPRPRRHDRGTSKVVKKRKK
jgi:putative nucleotidyltransferase with HDIG domain